MILIADSGSTKTDWCYGTEISNCKIIQTEGINPFHQSAEKIESIICQGLIPQLGFPLERCTAIYFYGAGCLPPKTESIIHGSSFRIINRWRYRFTGSSTCFV